MKNENFKDLFSGHAKDYARYRPTYPSVLFETVTEPCKTKNLAWDCGTGNGQAAIELAKTFRQVIATDPSAEQLSLAPKASNIDYRVAPAEKTNLENASVDLITVAQAMHWFKLEEFAREVKRVAKPDATLAVWCYSLATIDKALDEVTNELYIKELGKFWEPERKLVDEGYAGLALPIRNEQNPNITMTVDMTLEHWLAYLNTWSAIKKAVKVTGTNPIEKLKSNFAKAWGDAAHTKTVRFPVSIRMGTVAI